MDDIIKKYFLLQEYIMHLTLYRKPIPGIPMCDQDYIPYYNEVLLGYELVNHNDSCFESPDPSHMNCCGWLSVIGLFFLCWPLMCVPCFMSYSYSTYQRPVYGTTAFVVTYLD